MSIGMFFWIIIQLTVGYNLLLPVLFFLFYSIKIKKARGIEIKEEADYAIIVTAYEQTTMLNNVVKSILQLNYNNYLIYIVADKCDISNLKFENSRVILLRPEETLGSNTRSHFYAINRFVRSHSHLTIIDSDNLVHPEYLNILNEYFNKGYSAVQGVRAAKNLNTTFACLDAARDIYYHFYDGKLLFELGSSATLAGSGMAFTTSLYKECLQHLDVVGAGFDKVLQYEIIKRKYRIAFAEQAIVYDEKTSKSDQLVKQRARWINTWFKYFTFGFSLLKKGITTFNKNQFLFGLVLLRPPLFIFLLLSLTCLIINLFVAPFYAFIWAFALVLFVVGFLLALMHFETDKRIYKALVNIPTFIFYQLLSLAKVKKANSLSVATQHYHKENA